MVWLCSIGQVVGLPLNEIVVVLCVIVMSCHFFSDWTQLFHTIYHLGGTTRICELSGKSTKVRRVEPDIYIWLLRDTFLIVCNSPTQRRNSDQNLKPQVGKSGWMVGTEDFEAMRWDASCSSRIVVCLICNAWQMVSNLYVFKINKLSWGCLCQGWFITGLKWS